MFWTFLSRNLALLTLAGAVAAYLYPPLFLPMKDYFLWCFAATMFALGVVLHPEEGKSALSRPVQIGLGVLTQYSVMPLMGFAAATIAVNQGISPAIALGFVIVGCAPGAMASNVITYLAGGAVAFSIAMTMVATILSPLLTPMLVDMLGGAFLEIPFWPMMQTILMIVVAPLFLGMLLRPRLGPYGASAEIVAPGIAAIAIMIICSYAVAANQARIAEISIWLILLVVLLNGLGYLFGWGAAVLFNFDQKYKITMAIEIGMQNAGLGVALALKHFEPETALPGALFAVWCILTAAGMTRYLHQQKEPIAAV